MSYKEHAMREFEMVGWLKKKDYLQRMAMDNILELLEVFSDQGHSGFSAGYVISAFEKLVKFQPLGPLTGDDIEWVKISGDVFQNKRDGEVFKDAKNGEAYWIMGIIFEDKNGSRYTNKDSRVSVKFPWVRPERKIVKVDQ